MNFIESVASVAAAIASLFSSNPQVPQMPRPVNMPTPAALTHTIAMPSSAEEFFIRGLEKQSSGDYYFAIADFSKAINLRQDPRYFLARAIAYRKVDDGRALSDLNVVLKLQPQNHQAMVLRGFTYMGMGLFNLARGDFNQAIYLKPEPEYFYSRALLNRHEGRIEQSMADFNMAAQGFKLRGDNRQYQEMMKMMNVR